LYKEHKQLYPKKSYTLRRSTFKIEIILEIDFWNIFSRLKTLKFSVAPFLQQNKLEPKRNAVYTFAVDPGRYSCILQNLIRYIILQNKNIAPIHRK
jgi:hypothetical protein